MVNQQKFNGPKCDEKFHRQLLRRFGQLFPALKSPLGNLFPQYVVQMVYAEKILGREIRWEDLPPCSGVGAHGGLLRTKKRKIDYGAQQTSLGARPRLEPSPPTSPTTRLVTSPNQHAGQELSRLPLSNLAVRERQINFAANLANVPPTNLTNPVAETSSRLVEEQLTNERAIFESKLHDLEEKAARLETENESLV